MISTDIIIVGFCVKATIILQWKCLCHRLHIHRKHAQNFTYLVCVIYLPCKPFHINLKEMWLHKRDLDALSETLMPPVHAAILVANSGNALYRVKAIQVRTYCSLMIQIIACCLICTKPIPEIYPPPQITLEGCHMRVKASQLTSYINGCLIACAVYQNSAFTTKRAWNLLQYHEE